MSLVGLVVGGGHGGLMYSLRRLRRIRYDTSDKTLASGPYKWVTLSSDDVGGRTPDTHTQEVTRWRGSFISYDGSESNYSLRYDYYIS